MPGFTARFSRLSGPAALGIALAAVALTTVVVELLGPQRLTNGAMLYLAAVLLVALTLGRGAAILAAVGAAFAFDFFLVEPRFTLRVGDPDEWLVLLTFLLVAVVVSQLVANQRQRAEEAETRRREALLLHDVGELLAQNPFAQAVQGLCERVRDEFGAAAAAVEISGAGVPTTTVVSGDQRAWRESAGAPFTVLGDQVAGTGGRSPRWISVAPPRVGPPGRRGSRIVRAPIRSEGDLIGQISVVGADSSSVPSPGAARLLATAAAQLAVAVDRERLRGEATEADVLRRTSELKSALLNAVSHDLRTPLAAIIASAGSLRQADVTWSAEDRADFAESIELEAERLNRIVSNVLDLGRIEGGALRPARDWHDPALLLADVVERMRAHAQGTELVLELPDDLRPILLDPVEIDQVASNLIENAIRHAPPGTAVTVAGCTDDEGLRVSIADSGPGVAASAVARVFEPFYRSPSDARSAGSGIGLAVARGLVAAHGGRIWIEGREGGGACFTFVIPSPRAPEPNEA